LIIGSRALPPAEPLFVARRDTDGVALGLLVVAGADFIAEEDVEGGGVSEMAGTLVLIEQMGSSGVVVGSGVPDDADVDGVAGVDGVSVGVDVPVGLGQQSVGVGDGVAVDVAEVQLDTGVDVSLVGVAVLA
jgi:hypothetical protein